MNEPGKLRVMSPLSLIGAGGIGAGIGVLLQLWLSSRGRPTLVPPYSMAIALIALAIMLIVLGLRLRRLVEKGTGAVNPFHAVRLLATARAGQLVGAIFFGFGAGLLVPLLGRSVPAPETTWLPMLVTALAGAVLLGCAIITERLCRIPPSDEESGGDDTGLAKLES